MIKKYLQVINIVGGPKVTLLGGIELGVGGRGPFFRPIFRIWRVPFFLKPMSPLNTNQAKKIFLAIFGLLPDQNVGDGLF